MIKIYAMGYKGLYVLEHLPIDKFNYIDEVVLAEDKNIQNDYYIELVDLCTRKELKWRNRSDKSDIHTKYAIAISWRWIIDTSKTILIVLHDSLLPKYRGFNPLVTALINGDEKIGVTSLLASKEYDKGPIVNQKEIVLQYPVKIKDCIEIIAPIYLNLVDDAIEKITQNKLTFHSQDESMASYSLWRNSDDYFIDWQYSASEINRKIDAVGYPYLGAKTYLNGGVLTIFDAEEVNDVVIENRTPGKVIFKDHSSLTIVCGKGLLKVKEFFNEDNSRFDFTKQFRLLFG